MSLVKSVTAQTQQGQLAFVSQPFHDHSTFNFAATPGFKHTPENLFANVSAEQAIQAELSVA